MRISPTTTAIILAVTTVTLAGTSYYFYSESTTLTNQVQELTASRTDAEVRNQEKDEALAEASTTIAALSDKLDLTQEELDEVEDDYRREKRKNDDFEDEFRETIDTIKDLDKLSKTDEELLQKYSKVAFLNEHYVPTNLREIDDEFKYSEDRRHQLHSNVMPFFEEMLEDAKRDDIDLWVVSAYRSFDTQAQLKGAYLVQYGSGANTFSADQGFSEHQLGTAVDFTTGGLGGGLDGFGNTEAFEWLEDNAHKYGFILSYGQNNPFYVYEPWHWRFVGTELARDLNRSNDTFYTMDQREINEYLLNIFD